MGGKEKEGRVRGRGKGKGGEGKGKRMWRGPESGLPVLALGGPGQSNKRTESMRKKALSRAAPQ